MPNCQVRKREQPGAADAPVQACHSEMTVAFRGDYILESLLVLPD